MSFTKAKEDFKLEDHLAQRITLKKAASAAAAKVVKKTAKRDLNTKKLIEAIEDTDVKKTVEKFVKIFEENNVSEDNVRDIVLATADATNPLQVNEMLINIMIDKGASFADIINFRDILVQTNPFSESIFKDRMPDIRRASIAEMDGLIEFNISQDEIISDRDVENIIAIEDEELSKKLDRELDYKGERAEAFSLIGRPGNLKLKTAEDGYDELLDEIVRSDLNRERLLRSSTRKMFNNKSGLEEIIELGKFDNDTNLDRFARTYRLYKTGKSDLKKNPFVGEGIHPIGTGIVKVFAGPGFLTDIIERLGLLVAMKIGGNSAVAILNEINELADILLKHKIFSKKDHKIVVETHGSKN